MAKEPPVFLREATGLVRGVTTFDAVGINWTAMTTCTGLITFFSYSFLFPNANLTLAMLLTVVAFVPLGVLYAMCTAAMARSGGDYVFVSRALHPALGFSLLISLNLWLLFYLAAFTNWTFTLGIAPALSTIGAVSNLNYLSAVSTAVTQPLFIVVAGSVLIVITAVAGVLSSHWTLRIMAWLITIGMVSVAVMIFLFAATSNQAFQAAFNSYSMRYTNDTNYYNTIIQTAQKNGLTTGGFSWSDTISMMPFAAYIFIYYSSMQGLGGEIKHPGRTPYTAILITILISGLLSIGVAATYTNALTPPFYNAINYVYYSGLSYALPVAPSYNFLASLLTNNIVLVVVVNIGLITTSVALLLFTYVYTTKYFLAAAFDRILPARLADVSDKFHTPHIGVILMAVLAIIILPIYTYFATILATLSAFVGEAVFGYLVFGLAAIAFPFAKNTKAVYENSPIKKSLGGIPVITILGALTVAVIGFITYMVLVNSSYGVNSTPSLVALIVLAGGAVLFYFGRKAYLKHTTGFDLDLVFKQIPPE